MGFLIMGVIGYVVKLSEYNFGACAEARLRRIMLMANIVHIPVNNILVGGA
jgi:hypothetical protein